MPLDIRPGAVRSRKFWAAALFIALLSPVSILRAEPAASAELKVGVLLPFSGAAASVGADARQGIEMALEASKSGPKLKLVFADSKAEASTGVTEFRKLVDIDKVAAVYVLRGPVGMAINPISRATGIPILGGIGNLNFAAENPFAYQFWSLSNEEGAFLAEALIARNIRKIALITTEDDWTGSVSDSFKAEFQKRGGAVILEHELPPSESDFGTIVARFLSNEPDAIFANLTMTQLPQFLRRLREQNSSVPIFSNYFISKKDVIESAGLPIVEGVEFVEMNTDLPLLKKRVKEKFGSTCTGATVSAFLAATLLAQAAERNPQARSAAEINVELGKETEIHTADRTFEIHDRRVKFPLMMKVIRGGNVEPKI